MLLMIQCKANRRICSQNILPWEIFEESMSADFFLHSKVLSLERLHPAQSLLKTHTTRALLIENVWNNTLYPRVPQRDPSSWGWIIERGDTGLSACLPIWSELPLVISLTEHYQVLLHISLLGRCSCKKAKAICTSLCKCEYELCNESVSQTVFYNMHFISTFSTN